MRSFDVFRWTTIALVLLALAVSVVLEMGAETALEIAPPWSLVGDLLQSWPVRVLLFGIALALALIPLSRVRSYSRTGASRAKGRRASTRPEIQADVVEPRRFRSSWHPPAAAGADAEHAADPADLSRTEAPRATSRASDAETWGPRPVSRHRVPDFVPMSSDELTLDSDADSDDAVDSVDDVRNVVSADGFDADGPTTRYSISVVGGVDGAPHVRISVDLDADALAAALAVAGPVVSGDGGLAPVVELATARSAASQHLTAGVTPPMAFADGTTLRRRDLRARRGRRRAS